MLEDQLEALPGIHLLVVGNLDDAVQGLPGRGVAALFDSLPNAVLFANGAEIRPRPSDLAVFEEQRSHLASGFDRGSFVGGLATLAEAVPSLGLNERHAQGVPLLHQARLEDQRVRPLGAEALDGQCKTSLGVSCDEGLPHSVEQVHATLPPAIMEQSRDLLRMAGRQPGNPAAPSGLRRAFRTRPNHRPETPKSSPCESQAEFCR